MAIEPHIRPLLQPARPGVIGHHLGQLSLVLALFSLVPALTALALADYRLATSIALAAFLPSLVLALLGRRRQTLTPIRTNEAMVVVVTAFLLAALLMVVPFHGAGLSWIDALFEAVSGVTTTGLTTRATVGHDSAAVGFLRGWTQFCGGLGFAVLALALLAGHGAESRRLHDPSGAEEDLATSIRIHSRRTVAVYFVLAAGGVMVLWLAGLDAWNALLHTLTAVSTGGFSAFDDSLGNATTPVKAASALLALVAALPLILYYRIATRRDAVLLWRDPEWRALFAAVALVSVLLVAAGDLSVGDAVFHAVNAQTTTGFTSADLDALGDSSKLVLIFSMLTGAGLGSTGGGIKLLRVLILLRLVQLLVLRAQLPRHGVAQVRVGGSPLDDAQISRVGGVVMLYVMTIIVSWAFFVAAGHPPLDALFEVVSATATVGLSVGISGPELASWLKAVLCFDMLAGRLEVLALLVVLSPRTWWKRGS